MFKPTLRWLLALVLLHFSLAAFAQEEEKRRRAKKKKRLKPLQS